ncbi:MAG: hypothetical protein L6R42_004777, partial [Xanthoria sp. 1 TBL-2021]
SAAARKAKIGYIDSDDRDIDEDQAGDDADDLDQLALEYDMAEEDDSDMQKTDFIEYISRINISVMMRLSDAQSKRANGGSEEEYQQSISGIPQGNSRDEPTPFPFHCTTPGCEYFVFQRQFLKLHQLHKEVLPPDKNTVILLGNIKMMNLERRKKGRYHRSIDANVSYWGFRLFWYPTSVLPNLEDPDTSDSAVSCISY